MSKKVFEWLLLICIVANNVVFSMIYHMDLINICIVDLILYLLCTIAYHICFPEQIKKEREEIAKKYEEMLKNNNSEEKEN